MNNGISSKAPEKEQIKSDFECLIRGMNSTGMIDCIAYDDLFDEAMPLFDQMYELGKKEATTWHPFPKSKPKNDGEYLTTVLFKTGDKYVISNYWICNGGNGKWVDGFEHNIIAWAEQPEPYKEEGK